MPIMKIGLNNWDDVVAVKAMLQKLTEDIEKNKAQIKLQEEKIAKQTRKLKKNS